MNPRSRYLSLATATVTIALTMLGAAQTGQPAVPPGKATKYAKPAQQAEKPWQKIAIPPLPPFKPAQPKRIQLENGVVIFLQEDHELPFVNGFIRIRGGSRDEPAAKVGLVDLYGGTWRTSGSTSMSGDKMDDVLEAKAAKVETAPGQAYTALNWSSFKQDFDQVFGMATDLLLHPDFKQDKLLLSKRQIETGIVRRNDDPQGIAVREAIKLVYGAKSPYAREAEFATVEPIALADLQAWHKETLVGENISVGVVGDFDSAQMEGKLRSAFSSIEKGTRLPKPAAEDVAPATGVYLVKKPDVNQSTVLIVGLGTQRDNPDYFALSVMNDIFSGGFGSRLMQDVRTKLGLAYEVSGAFTASYDHPGIFYALAGTKSETTLDAAQAMMREIRDLKTTPPTDAEMRRSKDDILNSYIFNYDSATKILSAQMSLDFYGYPRDFLERFRTAIEQVSKEDVARVAEKYVQPGKLATLVVGNDADFGKPLTALGTVKDVDITIPMPPGAQAGGMQQ